MWELPVCEFCVGLVASIAVMNSMTKNSSLGRKGFTYAHIPMSLKLRQDPEGLTACYSVPNYLQSENSQSRKYSRSHGGCCL